MMKDCLLQNWPVDTSQLPSIPGPLPARDRRWLGRSPAERSHRWRSVWDGPAHICAMIFKRQGNSSSGCFGILYSGTLLFSMKRKPKGRVRKSCPADQDVPLDLSLGKVDHLTSRSRSSGIGSSTDWSQTRFKQPSPWPPKLYLTKGSRSQ